MQIAYNRTKRAEPPRYIVVHDTGNTGVGANARSHFSYFNGGNRGSSADVFVDDKEILVVNDYHAYYTWHCGDGGGKYGITNGNSVGVELCINSDGDYDKAFANLVRCVRELMAELGIDAGRVVRHYDASRKTCPGSFAGDNWARWKRFKEAIEGGLTMGQYEELRARLDKLENPMIYNYIDANMPAWARPTVQKLVDSGYLQGDGDGLGLTDDMLRILVILDRAGSFEK